jgi:hypothetical protein
MRLFFGRALFSLIGLATQAAVVRDDHEGPHKGIVVEWGEEEYHPELVIDSKTGTITAYIYGSDVDLKAAKFKPIDSKSLTLALKTNPATTVKLEPAPEKDDPKGKASKFTAKNDVFKKDMKWEGTLAGKVGNKPYSGDFKQK